MSAPRLPLATRALPYDLVATVRTADVADETIHVVDEAVSWAPDLGPADGRAFGLVVLALEEARAAGSTRLPLSTLPSRLSRLDIEAAVSDQAAALAAALTSRAAPISALAPLVGAPGDYKPFIVEGDFLYAHRDWLLEERLARNLAARLAAAPFSVVPRAIDEAIAGAAQPGRPWSAEQAAALRAALLRPLTVITGGPGTGKTALLAGLVRALGHLGIAAHELALAAPTGKAANRIAESLRGLAADAPAPEPRTLHRLLGYRGGRAAARAGEFRHHENFPLPHRAVLVDEASMIDLGLMERLARATRPDARLVLLGDADQLPSVDAGAVFRELGPLAIRLRESYRQDPSAPAGASVLAAARAVLAGDVAALQVAPRARPSELDFSGFELLAPAGAAPVADRRLIAAFADHWISARVRALAGHAALVRRVYRLRDGADGASFDDDDAQSLRVLIAHHASLRVVTVTRGAGAPSGAEALNAALARRAAAAQDLPTDAADPAPGTPILMIRNDYDRGLFNGDQGVLVRVATADAAPRLTAVFPRGAGLAAFTYDGLRDDLRVAYATTVHKAQGAELDHVALVLPERDLPLLSRELIYTALTRARRSAVVVGRWELLAVAIARPLERASGLGARLATLAAT
jgi:exodeoxyribonuclease V alpha subunit